MRWFIFPVLIGFALSYAADGVAAPDKHHKASPQHHAKSKHHVRSRYINDPWRWRYPYWRYGWDSQWNGTWGSYYWHRPYSGIGISIPLIMPRASLRRATTAKPVQILRPITQSMRYQSGLKTLPANAKVRQANGQIYYEWQGKYYRLDWSTQTYQEFEPD